MGEIWQRAKLRLAYLAIGLVIGLLSAGIPGAIVHKTTVREYDKRFELYATMTAQSVQTASELRAENEKLRTRKVERVNADGSRETITEVDRDSSSQAASNTQSNSQVVTEVREHASEWSKEQITERRSTYYLGLGLNQDGDKHIMFSYPLFFKPLKGHAWVDEKFGFGLGLGVEF